MRRLLRWLLGLDTVDDTTGRALNRRLMDVEDDLAHLQRQFNRLRGTVTGGIRHAYEPVDDGVDDVDPEDDDAAVAEEVLDMIKRRNAHGG